MIRHVVLIRFRPEVTTEEKVELFTAVASLRDVVDGMLVTHAGTNVSPEAEMDKGHADGFMVDFAHAAARDAYLAHPEHLEVARRLTAAAVDGPAGIIVFDLEITF